MISIIVPFFNSGEKIECCLDSIIRQSYQDFEIILINDGSSDNSPEIAKRYCEKYPTQIKYLEQKNKGVSSARNYGIEIATGEYLCFIDSDDYVLTDYLETLYNGIVSYNADIAMCELKNKNNGRQLNDETLNGPDEIIKSILTENNMGACNKLFKRILLNGLRFREDIYLGEDTLFFVEYAKNCQTGVFIHKELYSYDNPTSSLQYRNNSSYFKK